MPTFDYAFTGQLYMNQGHPTAYRVRTQRAARRRLLAWLEEYAPLERLAVLHAGVPDEAESLRDAVRDYWPIDGDVPIVQITPVLGAHLGPGALGFACISQEGASDVLA